MVGSTHNAHRARDLLEGRPDQLRRERIAAGLVIMLALLLGIAISVGAMIVVISP